MNYFPNVNKYKSTGNISDKIEGIDAVSLLKASLKVEKSIGGIYNSCVTKTAMSGVKIQFYNFQR
jgi:hypothetical protein